MTRGLRNGGFLSNPLNSGKTLFDISVNTDQIGMGFEAESCEKETIMTIFSNF